ncbi:hypothetical protein BGZ99_010054 [Dissophora globulifera]|uniref:Uncharacterized protein n=1 Tax=Dissophora globulifera TaxID=979702 RepID=A0A9P6UYT5_9FUNG|nr:hypothetical protein BGZ99_010054 [Dissophora globulifera]
MYTFFAPNVTVDITQAFFPLSVEWSTSATDLNDTLALYVIPSGALPYTEKNIYRNVIWINDIDNTFDDYIQPLHNKHEVPVNVGITYINSVPQSIQVLRNDFWGLFGSYNQTMEYTVDSTVESYYIANRTITTFKIPVMGLRSQQVLLVSASEAFSSWGGAFSFVFGMFYIIFGSRRITPFGLIQKFLMRATTKSKIANVYGNWKRDKNGNYHQGGRRVSSSASFSPLASIDPRSPGAQSVQYQQQAPLPFLPANTTPQSTYSQTVGSGQELSNVHQQQQIHHEELLSLRDQMKTHAKVLRHLQKHEQRFKDMETLLKEFYLDMDLVDTKGVVPDVDSLMSENESPTQDNKTSKSWLQGLFKKGYGSARTNVSEDESVRLQGAGYGMQGLNASPPSLPSLDMQPMELAPEQTLILY